jgi:hypothetical protein
VPAAPPAPPAPRAALAGTLGIFLVNVLIWAAVCIGNREWIYFWPVWTAIPLLLAVVGYLVNRAGRAG